MVDHRTQHPRAGKTTITPALATHCLKAVVKPVSESTEGRIIHDLKQKGSLPQTVWKTRRKSLLPVSPGDMVETDTVSIFLEGVKWYILTAIDVKTRFAFAYACETNSSAS